MSKPEHPALKALRAAGSALRSYQYGNSSPDLAKSIADAAEAAIPALEALIEERDRLLDLDVALQLKLRGERDELLAALEAITTQPNVYTFASWEDVPDNVNAIQCPTCDKITSEWGRYYDRHNIYSGRACSDACARSLPGQGDMWHYEAEEPIEEEA